MSAPDASTAESFNDLVDRAITDFGTECFWNMRGDLGAVDRARVVIDQLSKHGGIRGLRRAEAIRTSLAAAGEKHWR